MSAPAYYVETEVLEGTDDYNVGAVAVAVSGQAAKTLITTSDIDGSTISLAVYEQGNPTAVYSTSISKGTVWFNTPQVDAFWEGEDTIGYNFRHQIRQADIGATTLKGGRSYTFIYSIPTVSDGTLRAVYVWRMKALRI